MNDLDRKLVHLGDMMGDGMHHEPGGKWIEREYRKILVAQGFIPKRKKPDTQEINRRMLQRVQETPCACGGSLIQSRSGSCIAKCQHCSNRYRLLTRKKRSPGIKKQTGH